MKFVERLRDLAQSPQRFPDFIEKNIACRFSDEEGTGHFGSANNDQNLKMLAYEFAWLDFIMFKN